LSCIFYKKYNTANEIKFKKNVEALDIQCHILHINESLELNDENNQDQSTIVSNID